MWAVVLAESEIPEELREAAAHALSDVVGMVPLDAMGVVRRVQGVLLDNTIEFTARHLADKMAPRFEINFHVLVSHLLQGAPNAVRSPLLDRFAGGDLLEAEMVTDLKEFDLYNRWLLLAAAAFGDSAG